MRKPGGLNGIARRLVLRQLERLQHGRLVLVEDGQERSFGQANCDRAMVVRISVLDPRFFSELALGGSIGAGEAWMQGLWQCDDLVMLVRLLLRNREVLDSFEGGMARLTAPLQKLFAWVNRNTRTGARRNIAAHYDLGNDFFSLWLDRTMMYSSAIFTREDMTLEQAQLARLDIICQKLQLSESDHVIEIGTGWGGFAIYAAKNYGCRVTTTTISQEQYDLARQRIIDEGLHHQVKVLLEDFRDLDGQYDKLVSIEMIEAIGSSLYEPFFRKCGNLLKPGGLMLLQAITIADQRYAESQKSIDFIQRYIFPGSCLPSSLVMTSTAAESTQLRLLDLEDIGLNYARTLHIWRDNFFECLDQVRAQGYPESFIRMWEYYLCYCEGAFLERAISDVHMVYSGPEYTQTWARTGNSVLP
jgi:cyclopropane-fatty-acyl-phospholipid synthase